MQPRLPRYLEIPDPFWEKATRDEAGREEAASELHRRLHAHLHYIAAMEKFNNDHFNANMHPETDLKQDLFVHWEGDNVTLKTEIIRSTQR